MIRGYPHPEDHPANASPLSGLTAADIFQARPSRSQAVGDHLTTGSLAFRRVRLLLAAALVLCLSPRGNPRIRVHDNNYAEGIGAYDNRLVPIAPRSVRPCVYAEFSYRNRRQQSAAEPALTAAGRRHLYGAVEPGDAGESRYSFWTRTTRISQTFVWVGPVLISPPVFSKKPYASFRSR